MHVTHSEVAVKPLGGVSEGSEEFWSLMPQCRKNLVRGRVIDQKWFIAAGRLWGLRGGRWALHCPEYFSSVLSRVQLFVTAACQASLSLTNSQSSLRLMSIESVMPSNHLILCRPLLPCLQSFPALGAFQMSQFLPSGSESTGASASAPILPMNIQDWFPLGWTGWISLQFKGLSRIFSNTTVQKHQFFGTQLSLWSNSHIHTWWLEKP